MPAGPVATLAKTTGLTLVAATLWLPLASRLGFYLVFSAP
jgi:hypothetical protein